MFVAVFLGYNQYWPVGLMVLCPGAPKAQKIGPQLKVSSDILRPGIEPATPGLQDIDFSPTPPLRSDVPSRKIISTINFSNY